ncbi:hypothetical protein HU200_021245 [Digitaria exilis]|uniref:Uncharacterized protein n=1 Tax=Digitaria exilis TaxID=1010633 RepID=A0A835KE57_9POAL|nr:hypothetical protein HU200_021245 [Digitaria exilis]CAB3472848.1 unnamed protein product [Digitaria exilis]
MASGVVVRNDDESASLLDDDDDDMWSPILFTGGMSPPPPPLHEKATKTPAGHAVMRLIRSPFAAVFRMTTRGRPTATTSDARPPPEARRRPSLEQLLTLEQAAPPSPQPSRHPHRKSIPAADTVKEEKRAHREPLCPSKTTTRSTAVAVGGGDGERRRAVPVVKLDACGRRAMSAKKLVVVLESLRAPCSGDAAVSVVGRTVMAKAKGPNGKVASAAGAGRSPGAGKTTELFYSRPIPMGRRCRVQHLEESPYK